MIRSTTCAAQLAFTQRQTASSSGLNNLSPQTGQWVGKIISTSLPFLNSASYLTIYGITSPALSTNTVSPILKSFSRTTSSLNKEIDDTVTPPMGTGSIFATGVMEPVRPTWNSTFLNTDVAWRALNL